VFHCTLYGEQDFNGTVQTLEAHYACTNNAALTDNSLRMIHLSVQICTGMWIILRLLSVQIYTDSLTIRCLAFCPFAGSPPGSFTLWLVRPLGRSPPG